MPTDTLDHSTAFSARAFFFCCHKQTEQIVEKKNKILNLSQHTPIIEQKDQRETYQSAILNPQIAFISRQIALLAPIQDT
jgi:hypothetical protein